MRISWFEICWKIVSSNIRILLRFTGLGVDVITTDLLGELCVFVDAPIRTTESLDELFEVFPGVIAYTLELFGVVIVVDVLIFPLEFFDARLS